MRGKLFTHADKHCSTVANTLMHDGMLENSKTCVADCFVIIDTRGLDTEVSV